MAFLKKIKQSDPVADIKALSNNMRGADWLRQFSDCLKKPDTSGPVFATPNEIRCEYRTLRLRSFSKPRKTSDPALLIIAPLAVHDAGLADLMQGHSLVQALAQNTKSPIFLTDWISATPGMQNFCIDTYLSDLNVVIDDLGGTVDVIGLCQGGWLALLHAARFPGKIRRMVLAGTPVDTGARSSQMTHVARKLAADPAALPDDDIVNGAQWFGPLGSTQGLERAAIDTLQRNPASFERADLQAISSYEAWTRRTLDLPGLYCRDVLMQIFAGNDLAGGRFKVLGQTIDLARICIPLFVLCGARDEIVPKEQTLAALTLVGTPKARLRSLVAEGGHFSLFVGATTLAREWKTIAGWLTSQAPAGRKRA